VGVSPVELKWVSKPVISYKGMFDMTGSGAQLGGGCWDVGMLAPTDRLTGSGGQLGGGCWDVANIPTDRFDRVWGTTRGMMLGCWQHPN
jgi:hypothetical protein